MSASNNIIYTDLSSYNPQQSISFYQQIFGWEYQEKNGYYLAYQNKQPVAGLYETPLRFKQMRMPHFWMSYMHVNSVEESLEKAQNNLGIIEFIAQKDDANGRFALIRDPLGAGFTIYEGDLPSTRNTGVYNSLISSELHISDASKIIPFYQQLFGWKFIQTKEKHFQILNQEDQSVATAKEIPNTEKGKYEYWACIFLVQSIRKTLQYHHF